MHVPAPSLARTDGLFQHPHFQRLPRKSYDAPQSFRFRRGKEKYCNVRGTVVLLGCVAPAYPLCISEKFRVRAAALRKHALGSLISFRAESGCGPSATSLREPSISAFGGEAVVPQTSAEVRV